MALHARGFSNLGNKSATDPRNQLWKEYLRVVATARPKVFVLENVDRFSKSEEFQLLIEEANHGLISKYQLTWGVLLAADFGVAQRRPRTILIGSCIGEIDLPQPTHSRTGESGLRQWETVASRIAGLPVKPETTELPDSRTPYFGHNVPGRYKNLDIHFGRKPIEKSLSRYDWIPPGGGRFNLPEELLPRCWREKPTGTTDVMGRMRWDAPSLTIRTEFFKPEKGQYLHPQWEGRGSGNNTNRVITHYEASLLQDFPKNFEWCGTKAQIAKQIGNAVPAGLAAAVARHIRPFITSSPV